MKKMLCVSAVLLIFLHNLPGQRQPYMPGEKVVYQVRYGLINSGTATLELREGYWNELPVWHSVFTGQTTGIADALYKIRDIYESYIDPATDLPLFTIRNISEGRYKKYNENTFDHLTRQDSAIIVSNLSGKHIAPKGILDIVSCFYWFRKYYLANGDTILPGQVFTLTTWFTDELYPIIFRYAGAEMIKVKGGKMLCYRFHPVTEVGRVFKTEDDMAVWFSADQNFLPVKLRFDIFVGSFHVDMVSWEGLSAPPGIIN